MIPPRAHRSDRPRGDGEISQRNAQEGVDEGHDAERRHRPRVETADDDEEPVLLCSGAQLRRQALRRNELSSTPAHVKDRNENRTRGVYRVEIGAATAAG